MSTLKLRKQADGFVLDYGHVRLALDTGVRGETALLTHAHSDHLKGIENAHRVITTQATKEALLARGHRPRTKFEILNHGERIGQLGVVITSLNAGHVVGSSMYHIEFDEGLTVLYTGDFNVTDSMVHVAAEPKAADVLITEATYGTPDWIFPKRQEIYERILTTVGESIEKGRIPVFQAYSLGKAQEAIALLQRGGFNVVSGNHMIDQVSKVYNRHGRDLRHVSLRSNSARNMLKNGCAIVSSSHHHTRKSMRAHLDSGMASDVMGRLEHYVLSGWTLGDSSKTGFPLSAHSDFQGLLGFAKRVSPRIIYCFTANAARFSGHLSEEGFSAVPLE
ncbi:MAG: MBL fold metallo-hydrolase [Candidatus Thorarchaeota archaeon]|jgi:putative mRNA 3-end processing factor